MAHKKNITIAFSDALFRLTMRKSLLEHLVKRGIQVSMFCSTKQKMLHMNRKSNPKQNLFISVSGAAACVQ